MVVYNFNINQNWAIATHNQFLIYSEIYKLLDFHRISEVKNKQLLNRGYFFLKHHLFIKKAT